MSNFDEEKGPPCWDCGGDTVSGCTQDTYVWICVECDSFQADDTPSGVKGSNRLALASTARDYSGN